MLACRSSCVPTPEIWRLSASSAEYYFFVVATQANKGDFDLRCPLHFAAIEARLLAVSFLLGIAANPDVQDRWGFTPIDLALRGRSPQHMFA